MKPVIVTDQREPDPHPWFRWLGEKCDLQRGWPHPKLKKPACLTTADFCTPDAFSYDEATKTVLFRPRRLVERKAVSDMYGCATQERERFEKELIRIRDLQLFYGTETVVVIESSWDEFFVYATVEHDMNPKACIETFKAWERRFCPFVFCGSERASAYYSYIFLTGSMNPDTVANKGE